MDQVKFKNALFQVHDASKHELLRAEAFMVLCFFIKLVA